MRVLREWQEKVNDTQRPAKEWVDRRITVNWKEIENLIMRQIVLPEFLRSSIR